MDIFGTADQRDERLREFQNRPLLFTDMKNSTCSAEGKYSGVGFHEENLSELLIATREIVRIDSNFVHLVRNGYDGLEKKKTSNRGRRRKEKKKKNRKRQGDGTKFNSSIQFCVLGTHIRDVPDELDGHSHNARPESSIMRKGNSINREKIIKEYKIKLFRTGVFQVPGVLMEDMSDVMPPLEILRKYLDWMFLNDVQIISLFSVMRNYKFKLHQGHIDLRALHESCSSRIDDCININFKDLEKNLTKPIFKPPQQIHPYDEGWAVMLDMYSNTEISDMTLGELDLSISDFMENLEESVSFRNIYVNPDNLRVWISEMNMSPMYLKFLQYAKKLHGIVSEDALCGILRFMIAKPVSILKKKILNHPDNDLASVKYDASNYPGLLIRIKTPLPNKPDKKTTIKIFPKGKINIDGANNRNEAEFIYWWLNNVFTINSNFVYDEDYIHDESDSEFSESDSEGDDLNQDHQDLRE